MTGSAGNRTGDFAEWLAAQGEVLQRLAQEKDPARLRAELESWWQLAGKHAGPEAQQLAARLCEVGEQYLQGLQQFARAAAGELPAGEQAAGLNFGLDLLAAWRNARWGTGVGVDATSLLMAPWFEAIAKFPPSAATSGLVNDARELTSLHAQCQRIEAALTLLLEGVQHRALADLQAQIARRAQSEPVRDFHALYKLWVECGERAYAEAARDPEFIKLQADFTNTALRMRILQRRFAERMARALDLPTRAEVNSLHLQVRDLKRRLNRYENGANGVRRVSIEPSKTRTRKP